MSFCYRFFCSFSFCLLFFLVCPMRELHFTCENKFIITVDYLPYLLATLWYGPEATSCRQHEGCYRDRFLQKLSSCVYDHRALVNNLIVWSYSEVTAVSEVVNVMRFDAASASLQIATKEFPSSVVSEPISLE